QGTAAGAVTKGVDVDPEGLEGTDQLHHVVAGAGERCGRRRHVEGDPHGRAGAAAWRRAAHVAAAEASHVKADARALPAATFSARRETSSARRWRAAARASWSCGSTRRAAPPATSGSDEAVDVTTGVPWAMASRTGSPTPSKRLG